MIGTFCTNAQTFNPFYQTIVDNCEYDSLANTMITLTGFGVKEPGTQALDDTRDWILGKYADWGYTDVVDDAFTYSGFPVDNIIATKTGTVYPNTYLILCAHYDTKNGVGANDNGTGTSIILEMARLLKDVQTEYSIKFIHFSVEEEGLIGSQHYVDNTVIPQNLDILLVYNIDEVGGLSGMTNDIVTCERDESFPAGNDAASDAATTTLANCIQLYSNLNTEISYAYASDYMPFQSNGEIITGLYEKNETPYAHTAMDVMANLDTSYVFEILQGGLGAAIEFAIAIEPSNGTSEETISYDIYPNPVEDHFTISSNQLKGNEVVFNLSSLAGRIVYNEKIETFSGKKSLSIPNLESGSYLLDIISNNRSDSKIIVVH